MAGLVGMGIECAVRIVSMCDMEVSAGRARQTSANRKPYSCRSLNWTLAGCVRSVSCSTGSFVCAPDRPGSRDSAQWKMHVMCEDKITLCITMEPLTHEVW